MYDYCDRALERQNRDYWALVLQLLKPVCLEPVLCNKRSYCDEKPAHHNREHLKLSETRENPSSNGDSAPPKKKKMKVAIELSYREGWLYNVQKVKCLAPVNTPYIWSIAIIIH